MHKCRSCQRAAGNPGIGSVGVEGVDVDARLQGAEGLPHVKLTLASGSVFLATRTLSAVNKGCGCV